MSNTSNPTVGSLQRELRELRRDIDSLRAGMLTTARPMRSDLDLGGHRLVNVGTPQDKFDAEVRGRARGAYAPIDAYYVVTQANALLTNESVLTAGPGISITGATVSALGLTRAFILDSSGFNGVTATFTDALPFAPDLTYPVVLYLTSMTFLKRTTGTAGSGEFKLTGGTSRTVTYGTIPNAGDEVYGFAVPA